MTVVLLKYTATLVAVTGL